MAEPTRCVMTATMHAERLHDDAVWQRVRQLLEDWNRRRDRRWTLFVEPLRARVAGVDLKPRLDWLRDNGHEIAMHTHFYRLSPPGEPLTFHKEAALDPASLQRCLDEDLAYLADAGHSPAGFVAGSWTVLDFVPEWLASHEFRYDCTRRSYALTYPNPLAEAGSDHTSVERRGGLTFLPTTASASMLAKRRLRGRRCVISTGSGRYEMFYLHDYDLVRPRPRLAVGIIERLTRASEFLTADELIRTISGPAPSHW